MIKEAKSTVVTCNSYKANLSRAPVLFTFKMIKETTTIDENKKSVSFGRSDEHAFLFPQ